MVKTCTYLSTLHLCFFPLLIDFLLFRFLVLIEKILRTTPDVGKIYVLIKAKNEEAAMDRLKSEVCTYSYPCLFLSFHQTYHL